jgi:hypothetical protein
MQDSSEDLPKAPRRTAARPFFSPRASSGEGVTGPLELSRRRAAQLFTPPGSSPAAPLMDQGGTGEAGSNAMPASTPGESAEAEVAGAWSAAPAITPERTFDADSLLPALEAADDDHLVVEMYEHEEIELTASASNVADEHSIEVIAYDDANSLLKAAARDGKHPRVDGLQLETTEFSFDQESPPPRMSVDSFWASEPFARADESPATSAAPSRAADETESIIDEQTAAEPVRDAEVPAPMLADIAPPWRNRLTPLSTQALEEIKESEPWDRTPSDGSEPVAAEIEASVQEGEPWIAEAPSHEVSPDAAPSSPTSSVQYIADALVRIAARVRDGELEVPAGAEMSDEAALSVVLTSLLRARH